METLPVVKHLHIFEDFCFGLLPALEELTITEFDLKSSKKAFHCFIVPPISLAAQGIPS